MLFYFGEFMSEFLLNIRINPREIEEIKEMMKSLKGDEIKKVQVRAINKTTVGVRTDGVKMLTDYYALPSTAIRESWSISKAAFKSPVAAVSSKGAFIRLMKYGAKQVNSGVSVKVLKKGARKIVKHAFIGKLIPGQSQDQVYRREWHNNKRGGNISAAAQAMARKGYIWSKRQKRYIPAKWMEIFAQTGEYSEYRNPVNALYGPRIQDYLADSTHYDVLLKLAGERLTKNMKHEIDYILSTMNNNGK